MAQLPEKGTFKIATIGPKKEIPKKDKPNEHWLSYSLQFEGDANWYDTFWTKPEEPAVGMEISGEKDEHEKFGLQFKMDRQPGGKGNWNPAAAQSTVMLASVEVVNGFLAIGDHYALWDKGDAALKPKFDKYLATVESVSGRVKDMVVNMGSLQKEEKVADKPASSNGDPGPTPPPQIEGWPEGEEPQDI